MSFYADARSLPMSVAETLSERALGALWRRAHSLCDGLVTEDGRRFWVVYPGIPSARAGPDFLNAVIATESGELLSGDVELHLNAPDWYHHGHDTDLNYNGVVLHVVLNPRSRTPFVQQSGTTTPVVSIAGAVPKLERAAPSGYRFPVHPTTTDDGTVGDTLDRAGDERFLAKSRGFAMELAVGDFSPDQVLYRALMETLGYSSNRKPFRDLAARVPVSSLALLQREPPVTRLLAIKAMLLGASGLLPRVEPPEEASQLKALLRLLPRTSTMSSRKWKLFRVRPANHPVARITGAARLVEHYLASGLVCGLEVDAQRCDAASLLSLLMDRPFIGRGRAGDMIVNAILPFLHAYAGIGRRPFLRDTCIELYRSLPGLEDNEITREMRRMLCTEVAEMPTMTARRQQGLIQLYKAIPRRARHWSRHARKPAGPQGQALAISVPEAGVPDFMATSPAASPGTPAARQWPGRPAPGRTVRAPSAGLPAPS